MRHGGYTIRAGFILMASVIALLTLAACAPFGVASPPPRSALATATAGANATVQAGGSMVGAGATPVAHLPAFTADPGWVAVVQVPDGSALGGPSVIGGQTGAATASDTLTLGAFKLSAAAQVVVMFGCVSPANVRATLQIAVDVTSNTIQCSPDGATMNRSQMTMTPTDVGRTLNVTATITTDGQSPQWAALVEQPK